MHRDKDILPVAIHQVLVSHEIGGAGIVALHIAEFVKNRVSKAYVWIPGAGPAWRKADEIGLSVQLYNVTPALSAHMLRAAVTNWHMGRALKRLGPGIVHVHSPLYYGALSRGLKLSGLKCVAHVQIEEEARSLQWAFRRPPHLIITCAQYLVDHVRTHLPAQYQDKQKIVAVPNAVDIEKFTPANKRAAKARLGAPLEVPMALMLANLAPHKGQETTIRAMAHLKQQGTMMCCWIAGIERGDTEHYTTYLRTLVHDLALEDTVRFLGQRDDTPDLLRAADMLLLPSTVEGLPLSILEAQATKVPVLAAPTAGIPEIIKDGQTGLLIPAGDVNGYVAGIQQLLAQPSLSHGIAEAAYVQATQKHNWENLCKRVWDLYHDLWTH